MRTFICSKHDAEYHSRATGCPVCQRLEWDAQDARDLVKLLDAQREWSEATFGPGPRTAGVLAHIRKELKEIEDAPDDAEEWIDVVILALDGAWRSGRSSQEIVDVLNAKYKKNRNRQWPDWRTADPDGPIEHVRTIDEQAEDVRHEQLKARIERRQSEVTS